MSIDQSLLGYGSYGETEVELVGGPLDGEVKTMSNHPLANSRFWVDLPHGQRAWYQYYGYWYGDGTMSKKAIAYYLDTTTG